MTHTTPVSPLYRLASLASQRTARTDRLHEAVGALLTRLEPHVEPGDSVTVDGWTLARIIHRSNVGWSTDWSFWKSDDDDDGALRSCDPERPVDGEGYTHGDFSCPWRGPTRAQLVALASRAGAIVGALVERHERTVAKLATAERVAREAVPA